MRYVVVLGLMLAFIAVGCGAAATPTPVALRDIPVPAKPMPIGVITVGNTTTYGNYSYITLNLPGNSNEHLSEIFQALKDFEDAHPGLEIIGPPIIDRHQVDYYTTLGRIFGMWLYHKPKIR